MRLVNPGSGNSLKRHSVPKQRWITLAATIAVLVAGCSSPGDEPPESDERVAVSGGSIHLLLDDASAWDLDPQGAHSRESGAFVSAFLHRTLVTYPSAPAATDQLMLTPDLATDTGTVDGTGTQWSFTLRDDAVWEDGAPVTCADVKYGVSRRFAESLFPTSPRHAIDLLDVPFEADGRTSRYQGPYSGRGQRFFDAAVTCEGSTITFRLREPRADFGEIVALPAFSPVREDRDIGENYGHQPLSSGPYRVLENPDAGKTLLVRNENWEPQSDPTRPAYPDEVVLEFGLDPDEIDLRLTADDGADRFALGAASQDDSLVRASDDADLEARRWNQPDLSVEFFAINTALLPNISHRQAVVAAFDRQSYLEALGGGYHGSSVEGVVSPALALDYADTGLWTGGLGQPIGPQGDPDLASDLIDAAGVDIPILRIDYPDSPAYASAIATFVAAMEVAGIDSQPNPIDPATYYNTVLNAEDASHLAWVSWSADLPNASTVLPPLYAQDGGFNLSRVNRQSGIRDVRLQSLIDEGLTESSRLDQGELWQRVNALASDLALVVPAAATRQQRAWGSGLAGVRYFAPFASYDYGAIYVKP